MSCGQQTIKAAKKRSVSLYWGWKLNCLSCQNVAVYCKVVLWKKASPLDMLVIACHRNSDLLSEQPIQKVSEFLTGVKIQITFHRSQYTGHRATDNETALCLLALTSLQNALLNRGEAVWLSNLSKVQRLLLGLICGM